MTEQSAWEKAARQLHDDMKKMAPMIAASMSPAPNTTPVSPEHERRMYWQRAISPDEEQMLWQSIIEEGLAEGMDYEGAIARAMPRVAMGVYPTRAPLIRQGARALSINEQIAYANRMEKLGPPGEEGGDEYGS